MNLLRRKISKTKKGRNEFSVPENYFEDLERKILESSEQDSSRLEFNTPSNYFENLEKNILKISESKPVKIYSLNVKKTILIISSIAAILIVFISIYRNNSSDISNEDLYLLYQNDLISISSENIDALVFESDFELPDANIVRTELEKAEIDYLLNQMYNHQLLN